MNLKNPMVTWRIKDIIIFTVSVVGLGLLWVYGGRALAQADDKRFVEGWHSDQVSQPEEPVSGHDWQIYDTDLEPLEAVIVEADREETKASIDSSLERYEAKRKELLDKFMHWRNRQEHQ